MRVAELDEQFEAIPGEDEHLVPQVLQDRTLPINALREVYYSARAQLVQDVMLRPPFARDRA